MSYVCEFCHIKKYTKQMFDRHSHFCQWKHSSELDRDASEITPTMKILFQYVLDLNEKCNRLENTVEKLKKQTIAKKSVFEYLQSIALPRHFQQWFDDCVVDEVHHLRILFEKGMSECIQSVLFGDSVDADQSALPFRCFTQKPNTIFVYIEEKDEDDVEKDDDVLKKHWRSMDPHEFNKMIKRISHRITRTYIQWKNQHRDEIETNEKEQEQHMEYMKRLNSCTSDHKIAEIKKIFIQKMQVSLKYIS